MANLVLLSLLFINVILRILALEGELVLGLWLTGVGGFLQGPWLGHVPWKSQCWERQASHCTTLPPVGTDLGLGLRPAERRKDILAYGGCDLLPTVF